MRIIPTGGWEQQSARALRAMGWVCHEPGQSCIGNNHAYQGQQDTSYGASVYVLPKTGTQRERVWNALRRSSATDVELQNRLGMGGNTERPRRKELVEGGFVRDSGTRKKHHGEEHIVWEAVQ